MARAAAVGAAVLLRLLLEAPVATYIPAFAGVKVGGGAAGPAPSPAR